MHVNKTIVTPNAINRGIVVSVLFTCSRVLNCRIILEERTEYCGFLVPYANNSTEKRYATKGLGFTVPDLAYHGVRKSKTLALVFHRGVCV